MDFDERYENLTSTLLLSSVEYPLVPFDSDISAGTSIDLARPWSLHLTLVLLRPKISADILRILSPTPQESCRLVSTTSFVSRAIVPLGKSRSRLRVINGSSLTTSANRRNLRSCTGSCVCFNVAPEMTGT